MLGTFQGPNQFVVLLPLSEKTPIPFCEYHSFYKPPSAPVSRIDYIADILADLHQRTSCSCPSVVVSGDFNVGDINWTTDPPTLFNTSPSSADAEYLLNFLDDYSLTQSVTQVSRPASSKTLDLVLSSAPSLVSNVQIHSGVSEHDVVIFTILH